MLQLYSLYELSDHAQYHPIICHFPVLEKSRTYRIIGSLLYTYYFFILQVKDLKYDVRRYQMQVHEASVYECQKCRKRNERQVHAEVQTEGMTFNPSSCVEGHGMTILEEQLRKAEKKIDILKKLSRHRNAKIKDLESTSKSR